MLNGINFEGLNVSSIAKDAEITPSRLHFAIKDYDTHKMVPLSAKEERKVVWTLKRLIKRLNADIFNYENNK